MWGCSPVEERGLRPFPASASASPALPHQWSRQHGWGRKEGRGQGGREGERSGNVPGPSGMQWVQERPTWTLAGVGADRRCRRYAGASSVRNCRCTEGRRRLAIARDHSWITGLRSGALRLEFGRLESGGKIYQRCCCAMVLLGEKEEEERTAW